MDIDWCSLEDHLIRCIELVVAEAAEQHPANTVYAAALTDVHARDMLFLWPSIRVAWQPQGSPATERGDLRKRDVDDWDRLVDAPPTGDLWAERLTASVGRHGHPWNVVAAQFHRSLGNACRRATATLPGSAHLDDDFVVLVHDPECREAAIRASVDDEVLRRLFPELHRTSAIEARLDRLSEPDRIDALVEILTSDTDTDGELRPVARRLLAAQGPIAAQRVVDELRSTPLDPSNSHRVDRLYDVLIDTGITDSQVADRLADTVERAGNRPVDVAKAATVLCMLGHVHRATHLVAGLPDDMAAQALSAPFLAEHRRTPLDYRLLAEILAARPVLDDLMLASLTPTRIHDIAHEDLRTASDALASPWQFIRRHAAIVLLSSHL
ncbi:MULTISPECIES: hypothetical protein [Gordonia]|uniref:hypothetical protein n=1 Tax=Gordonia TaxID=2053 RepID=UPI001CFA97C0|nr:hypothetical protein [Gordonia sp. WA4-43]UCZ87957.1 hypothetical protein LEL84_12550 [Gordonia sp. WA4-43]